MKVMTVLGTRPEIIRLSRVISRLDEHFHHILVHTGQNYDYELNKVFFEDLAIRAPDHYLNANGTNAAETIARVISETDKVLESESPDAILVVGDTNSALSVIPAKRRKIPVFHMEAGNRCFDERVPEEINRRIVDHVADINMPYSSIAREYLIREGIPPERIVKTGSPMKEVLDYSQSRIEASRVLSALDLQQSEYIVVSSHREENVDDKSQLQCLVSTLNLLSRTYKMPVIVSTHPRTRKRFESINAVFDANVRALKPLGFLDYVKLEKNALITLSDSGTITEESSILGFAAVNIREAHERPEGMEEGTVIMSGLNPNKVLEAVQTTLAQKGEGYTPLIAADYDVPIVSEKVVRIIFSYTDYVNRVVWKKQ